MRGGCKPIRQSDGPVLDRPVFFLWPWTAGTPEMQEHFPAMAMDGRYAGNAGAFSGDAMDGRYAGRSARIQAIFAGFEFAHHGHSCAAVASVGTAARRAHMRLH